MHRVKMFLDELRSIRLWWVLMTVVLGVLGVGVLLYTGPGRGLVRGFMGDVLVVMWMIAGFGVFWPRARRVRVLGVFLFACSLEVIQAFGVLGSDAPRWLRVVLGATFDVWDLVAYVVGAVVMWRMEVRWAPCLERETGSWGCDSV